MNRSLLLLAALALALSACKGEKGDAGTPGLAGQDGKSSLTLNAAEPPGANCPTGGVRVDFGLDANGNNVLDPGEVDPARTS